MREEIKPSNLGDKLMDCNNSDLPKGSSPKISGVENNFLNTDSKADSSLMKKSDPDKKRVEELSAKEQECRRKFKEKFNKLKKMPMPPQPTINVNSEGLTEATPELEKNVGKKQPNDMKVCVGTKPIESAIYRFTCVLPMKRSAAAGKDLESMLCKPVDGLPEQFVNNEQIILISKNKSKTPNAGATGNNEQTVLPPKPNKKPNVGNKVLETKENLNQTSTIVNAAPLTEHIPRQSAASAAPIPPAKNNEKITIPTKSKDIDLMKPTIDLAPYDIPKPNDNKSLKIVGKEKNVGLLNPQELQQQSNKANSVRGGILSSIIKNFAFDSKMFKPKSWFSGKAKETKMRMLPMSSLSKIPLRWRQGFVILGTFIPFYYTYHKIVTDNKLTTIRIPEKN